MLPRWYPNVKDPADGNFIEQHIHAISQKIDVQVLFVKGLNEISRKEVKNYRASQQLNCLTVYYPLNKGILKFILNPLFYFLAQLRAFDMIKKEKGLPALCHVHVMARSSLLANYLKITKGISFLISEHWSGYFPETGKLTSLKKIIYRMLYKRASKVTAVSRSLSDAISKIGIKQNIQVVPNIVQDVFLTTKPVNARNSKVLLHISNLINEVKQTDKIIHYLNELASNRNDFELLIVGDGVDKASLEIQAQSSKNLDNRIKFTGDIPPAQLAEYISKSIAVVSFSKYETQSIVLLESIAIGIPVVAPNVGGIPEHCSGRGLLFKVNSKDAFLQSVKDILDEKIDYNQIEMKEYAKKHFSSEKIAEEFYGIYLKIQPRLDV